MNTKSKGDIAVADAINYFVKREIEVCLPLGDRKDYDLVIDMGGYLKKVQVKYAGLYADGKCRVGLRITGGNQKILTAKKYADDAFDLLFVYTQKNTRYLIPWEDIKLRNEISIENYKYEKFKV